MTTPDRQRAVDRDHGQRWRWINLTSLPRSPPPPETARLDNNIGEPTAMADGFGGLIRGSTIAVAGDGIGPTEFPCPPRLDQGARGIVFV
jgi:hypothetical protein